MAVRKTTVKAKAAKPISASIHETVEKTRTLYAEIHGGNMRKITIPVSWVITFGPIGVGQRRDGSESPNVLRIYSDARRTDLVAVYRDIKTVSDERVIVTERTTKKKQKVFNKAGPKGNQSFAAEARKTEWVNPFADEPEADDSGFDEQFLALPAGMLDDSDIPA